MPARVGTKKAHATAVAAWMAARTRKVTSICFATGLDASGRQVRTYQKPTC